MLNIGDRVVVYMPGYIYNGHIEWAKQFLTRKQCRIWMMSPAIYGSSYRDPPVGIKEFCNDRMEPIFGRIIAIDTNTSICAIFTDNKHIHIIHIRGLLKVMEG